MQTFPIGKNLKMAEQAINPYPRFEQMLESEAVSWIDEIGMWYVTRREDVLKILADSETFTVVSEKSLMLQGLGHNMLTTDGAEQARLRRPFATAFAPRGIRGEAVPFIENLSKNLIEGFAGKSVIDVKADLADIIAIQTVIQLLGLSAADYAQVRTWVSDFAAVMSNFRGDEAVIQRGKSSKESFSDYVLNHVNALRKNPNETVLGRMVKEQDYQLSDAEIVDASRVIIFGGVETTSALIANALWCLLSHPEQLKAVRANSDLLPNAIEESLRYESPVQTCTRHILRSVNIAGVQLREGDTLQCMLGAANRDPAYFQNANRFDIYRENTRDHLAFANGKHFCIGAGLARMEAEVSIRVLLECFETLGLAYPQEDVPHGYEFRSPKRLRLSLN